MVPGKGSYLEGLDLGTEILDIPWMAQGAVEVDTGYGISRRWGLGQDPGGLF